MPACRRCGSAGAALLPSPAARRPATHLQLVRPLVSEALAVGGHERTFELRGGVRPKGGALLVEDQGQRLHKHLQPRGGHRHRKVGVLVVPSLVPRVKASHLQACGGHVVWRGGRLLPPPERPNVLLTPPAVPATVEAIHARPAGQRLCFSTTHACGYGLGGVRAYRRPRRRAAGTPSAHRNVSLALVNSFFLNTMHAADA